MQRAIITIAVIGVLIFVWVENSGPDDFLEFNHEMVPPQTWEATSDVCNAYREVMSRLQADDQVTAAAAGETLHQLAGAYTPAYETVPSGLSPSGPFGHVYYGLQRLGDMLKDGAPDPVAFDDEVRDIRGNCGALDRMRTGDWPVDAVLEYVTTDGGLGWSGDRR